MSAPQRQTDRQADKQGDDDMKYEDTVKTIINIWRNENKKNRINGKKEKKWLRTKHIILGPLIAKHTVDHSTHIQAERIKKEKN